MPEKRPKISQEQPKGKLTPEEVKEMVKKYKKEHEGLLPEYFSLPGEEKEEEKREYSEETILAYKIKEFLEKIRPEIENETLIENVKEELRLRIEKGNIREESVILNVWSAIEIYNDLKQSNFWFLLKSDDQKWIEKNIKKSQLIENAKEGLVSDIKKSKWMSVVFYYNLLKQSNLWNYVNQDDQKWIEKNIKKSQLDVKEISEITKELKSEINHAQGTGDAAVEDSFLPISGYIQLKQSNFWFQLEPEDQKWIEENIKNYQLIENCKKIFKIAVRHGQNPGETSWASASIALYCDFSQFQKILEEQGRKKEIAKEKEKAMHPEKKKLPSMPEEKAF
jgi:hypothetical protein